MVDEVKGWVLGCLASSPGWVRSSSESSEASCASMGPLHQNFHHSHH